MRNILSVLVILLLTSTGISGEFHVTSSQKNLVKFISDAPIEDFEGVTDKIDGYLYWEGDDFTNKSDVYFEVDLNSLDTGIGLRNRHMRENYLHTDQYPTTNFKGKLIKSEKIANNQYKVEAQGNMFIHGVERLKSIQAIITKNGDLYNIKSEFGVKLSDYKIEIPSIMFYKIDETMSLVLDFYVEKFIPEEQAASN